MRFSKKTETFYLGPLNNCYLGYSTDPEIRKHCASGGIVSAILIELLESAYPKWQEHKNELNRGILGFFEWGCQSNPKLKDVIRN